MKVKVSTATGAQLDWMVAKAQKLHVRFWTEPARVEFLHPNTGWTAVSYSTNWAQGGPIVEREGVEINKGNPLHFPRGNENGDFYEDLWIAGKAHGPTPLIAAMRCFVISEFGEEVDVPDELCEVPTRKKAMRLVDQAGNQVALPCTINDFRGKPHKLTSVQPPSHPGSTGRVYSEKGEFFPSVFNLGWVEVEA